MEENNNITTENIDIVENKSETAKVENVIEEVSTDTKNKSADKGYFKYYLFILINSIVGFILLLYFSRHIIDFLASKNIVNLVNVKPVVSIVVASTTTMLFMFFSLVFKKFFRMIFFSEIFLYIYIGGLTTIINILSWNISFNLINKFIVSDNIAWKVAEAIAFVIAIIFAFFADKLVVFKSYSFKPEKVFTELGIFIGARLLTELINVGLMVLIIDINKQAPLTGKIIASIVVIIVNYLFSKFIIFRKNKKSNEEQN